MKHSLLTHLKTLGVIAATALAFQATAQAQSYPTRPITMIVPFPAGSATDTVARLVGQKMSEKLQQPVVMENVPGASGTIAAAKAARANPDGYTLMIHTTIALSAALYKNLSYDTATAFAPIGLINNGPYVITANNNFKAQDAKELFGLFKSQGNKISLANAGVGTGSHLCAIMLSEALNVHPNLIPYKSTSQAMMDVMAGNSDVLCDQTTNALPHIAAKKIKVYAITSPKRAPYLPDVPTTRELGLPQVDVSVWHGLYAPKGTSPAIVQQVNEALQSALADPGVQKRLADLGTEPFPADQRSPAAHAKLLASELVRFRELAQKANLQLD